MLEAEWLGGHSDALTFARLAASDFAGATAVSGRLQALCELSALCLGEKRKLLDLRTLNYISEAGVCL